MAILNELTERMDRIKILMDYTQMNIEEMLAVYADNNVKCNDCPIISRCGFGTSCYDAWLKYFNNESE